jgi:flagellar FliL protein
MPTSAESEMATKPQQTSRSPAKEEAPAAALPEKCDRRHRLLLVGIAGGAGWFFSKGSAPAAGHEEAAKADQPVHEAKFVALGENFTVNLQREEGDQYLQAGITLKILQPELEEKIKAQMPEIRSKLLFLLSAKKPSELQTVEGKRKLIAEIIAEVDGLLGLGAPAARYRYMIRRVRCGLCRNPASAPVATTATKTTGVVDVLFTSFIIQ